jgi:hypothetical protein
VAQKLSAPVVTADHAEFEPAAENGFCGVRFIRGAEALPG